MTLQFSNKESVINAYDNRNVEAWAIHQGKQFMFKGIGRDELITILDSISKGGTNAIYTLKVFEDIDDLKAIKNNTPDDGSFNFRLNADEMIVTQSAYTSALSNMAIAKKLEEIEERLNRDELEEVEETEKPESLGVIGKILDHPAITPLIPVLMEKIISTIFKNEPTQADKLKYAPSMAINGITEDELIKSLIEKLKLYDKNIIIHLNKLIEIAETNPVLFNSIISAL